MSDLRPKIYAFGPFRIDLDERQLFRAGEPIPLAPKVFEPLVVLVERPGKIVEKAELLNSSGRTRLLRRIISLRTSLLSGGHLEIWGTSRPFRDEATVSGWRRCDSGA